MAQFYGKRCPPELSHYNGKTWVKPFALQWRSSEQGGACIFTVYCLVIIFGTNISMPGNSSLTYIPNYVNRDVHN